MVYHVRAVNRALALLRCFGHDAPELGLAELASCTNLSMSTALRLLSTLEDARFIEHDDKSGQYRLGIVCLELGLSALDHLDLWQAAAQHLRLLRDETGETVSLTVLDGDDVLYVTVLETPQPVRIAAGLGRRLPGHCTSTGKVLLAFMSPERMERALSRDLKCYTPKTICDPNVLRDEFKRIRELGYSISEEQYEPGIAAVAAPVRDQHGQVVAAVGLAGPIYRIPHERAIALAEAVRVAAASISRQMGAVPPEWQNQVP